MFRHYYRIKQQYIKLYFERYCLEHNQLSNKAHNQTKDDSDDEFFTPKVPGASSGTIESTAAAFADEYWKGKKKPNYMLNVSYPNAKLT